MKKKIAAPRGAARFHIDDESLLVSRPVRKESSGVITKQQVMAMNSNDTLSARERARSYSLTALILLADPVSTFLDRGRLVAIAEIALRREQPITRGELALIRDCAQKVRWLRPKLKHAITVAYARGVIDAATTQRLVDGFELWSD
jgi:hypothetical protein